MSRFIIENRLTKPEQLTGFNSEGYFFDEDSSSNGELVFKPGSVKFVVNAGCGVNALSGLQKHADSIYCRIRIRYCYGLQVFSWSGFPDCRHARHSAVRRCFFIPSAIFTPLPDYAVTHRTARLTSALHTPPVPACASSRRESPFLSCH